MFPGNPAVYIRSVAFRPCLATGLALLREVTYIERLYDDTSGLSNFHEALREIFGPVRKWGWSSYDTTDCHIPWSMAVTRKSRLRSECRSGRKKAGPPGSVIRKAVLIAEIYLSAKGITRHSFQSRISTVSCRNFLTAKIGTSWR
jgi:hypothetical protein